MNDIKSPLTFNKYFIEDFKFSRNEEVNSGKYDLELNLNATVGIHEDEDKARITLHCEIFDEEFKEKNRPFHIKASIVGYFTCETAKVEDFQFNGMAILFPYLRGFISGVTAQAGIPPVTLPTINVYKYFEQKKD